MNTFLPYPSFHRSAQVLDSRRLGKQRIEALQILRAIQNPRYGWQHHPAVSMWRAYPQALGLYGLIICAEWRRRGYRDNVARQLQEYLQDHTGPEASPWWHGRRRLHASHRSNLLRKDPGHYGQLGWREPPGLPYWWPTGERRVRGRPRG